MPLSANAAQAVPSSSAQSLLQLLKMFAMGAAIPGGATPAHAQAHDQARTTIGIVGGYLSGTHLWSVTGQLIIPPSGPNYRIAVDRSLAASPVYGVQGTRYVSASVGWTAEVTYVGLPTRDRCEPAAGICNLIAGKSPGSAMSIAGGLTIRSFSHGFVQPYARGMLGVVFLARSTVEVLSGSLYVDGLTSDARPEAMGMIGIATSADPGYQLTLEARGLVTRLAVVTGTTAQQAQSPPTTTQLKFFPGITAGLHIVLSRLRGRRY